MYYLGIEVCFSICDIGLSLSSGNFNGNVVSGDEKTWDSPDI